MQCEDKVETEHSLAKVHKVCRLIGIIVKIIFVVFCVCWLSTVLLMIYSLINPSELGAAEGVSVPRIALYCTWFCGSANLCCVYWHIR